MKYHLTETERAQEPDTPKWLDRRWRYSVPPPILPAMRRTLLLRALKEYGPDCHWCGIETHWPNRANGERSGTKPYHRTLEHLIPRGMGGLDTFENTRIACYECNTKRGVWQQWMIWLYRLKSLAPNRLFGAYVIGGEAV